MPSFVHTGSPFSQFSFSFWESAGGKTGSGSQFRGDFAAGPLFPVIGVNWRWKTRFDELTWITEHDH